MLTRQGAIWRGKTAPGFLKVERTWLVRIALVGLGLGIFWGRSPTNLRAASVSDLERALNPNQQLGVARPQLEASRGVWLDFTLGRSLFFEGRELGDPSAKADIYHARITTSLSGELVGVRSVTNMTRTKDADEGDLTLGAGYVYYATRASRPSLTLLRRLDKPPSLEASLRELVRSGSWSVYQRTHIYPRPGVREVKLQSGPSGSLELNRPDLVVEKEPFPSSPFLHLAADVGRSLFGPEPIALAEEALFRLRAPFDFGFGASGQPAATAAPEAVAKARSTGALGGPAAVNEASPREATTRTFPPEGGTLAWSEAQLPAGTPGGLAFLAQVPPRTRASGTEVWLTLFDMGRLELGIMGGYREPEPETGPPDRGHIPSDPGDFSRVVATFNGGFQSAHGSFGMKSEGRLLVSPHEGLATVRIDADGRVGLGTWTKELSPNDYPAFRQNLEPLLVSGVFDPQHRGHFGDHLLASGVFTERSALCVTESGHLIFAWAKSTDPEGLARALELGRCSYGIHLDMNPGHCSLSFHKVHSFEPLRADSLLLSPEMKVNAGRFLRWSPKDFFFLSLLKPQAAVASNEEKSGSAEVELERVPAWSTRIRVMPGSADGGAGARVAPSGKYRAYGLGHRTHGSRPGLYLEGRWLVPSHRAFGGLELTAKGHVHLHSTGNAPAPEPGSTWIGLPALIENGSPTELARELGDTRARAAVCMPVSGVLLFARAWGDSAHALTEALVREGCKLALLLDRGSHHSAMRRSSISPSDGLHGVPPEGAQAINEDPALPSEHPQSLLIFEERVAFPRAYSFTSPSSVGAW